MLSPFRLVIARVFYFILFLFSELLDNKRIFSFIFTDIANSCVDAWYREIALYNFTSPVIDNYNGHFTQLVWNSSTQIGVGFSIRKNPTKFVYTCVAQYYTPGNVMDKSIILANIKPAKNATSTP